VKQRKESDEWGLMRPAVLAWLRLARVYQKIEMHSEQLFRSHRLNSAQFDVIAHVGAASGLSQQALADALLVTKGNVSQLLRKLEGRGLVERRHDGRTNCLSLTGQGKELFDTVVPSQEKLVSAMLDPLSVDEQRELLRLLRKLDRAIVG
jgi:DNA-binding MarR family transcriptional regulator